jgi:pimeloyl-ACP methyl ester carboxylesterase
VPEEVLDVEVDGARLATTVSLPEATRAPVVVVAHGARYGTRDAPLYEHLRAVLPPAGVAVATFDRRGEGASTGEVSGSFERRVADIARVVERVRTLDGVDASRVGLWGWSQGGWLAPIAAARDPSIAFLVLVSPSGVPPSRQMAYATARVLRSLGFEDATVRRVSALRRRLDDAFRRGVASTVIPSVDAVRDEPWFDDAHLPDPVADGGAWAEIMDLDIRPSIARLNVPVLLTHGEDDRWVPVEESLDVWRRSYRGPRLEVARLPRTGHTPTIADDPADLEERGPVSLEYERALLSFLARVAT